MIQSSHFQSQSKLAGKQLSALGLLLFALLCNGHAGISEERNNLPSWVTAPPTADGILYGVGASAITGDEGEALKLALANAKFEVLHQLGSDISSQINITSNTINNDERSNQVLKYSLLSEQKFIALIKPEKQEIVYEGDQQTYYALVSLNTKELSKLLTDIINNRINSFNNLTITACQDIELTCFLSYLRQRNSILQLDSAVQLSTMLPGSAIDPSIVEKVSNLKQLSPILKQKITLSINTNSNTAIEEISIYAKRDGYRIKAESNAESNVESDHKENSTSKNTVDIDILHQETCNERQELYICEATIEIELNAGRATQHKTITQNGRSFDKHKAIADMKYQLALTIYKTIIELIINSA
ncbi:MAG: hypothetical protein QM538_05710 [Methylacidiphilales bacterium]|nr:hypothetical protein [Candidatus Methylacidiphilales bacterium]